MTHIFNIAVDFDDERIRQVVEQEARNEIVQKILKDVENLLFSHNAGWSAVREPEHNRNGLQAYTQDIVEGFLDKPENREEIIERTSKMLAEKLVKSKRGQAILSDLVGKDDG